MNRLGLFGIHHQQALQIYLSVRWCFLPAQSLLSIQESYDVKAFFDLQVLVCPQARIVAPSHTQAKNAKNAALLYYVY